MSKAILIKAKEKENKTTNAIRRDGNLPATIYGHSLKSISVQVNAKDFSRIPHKAYSHINELEIEGKEKFPVIIRNVHKDPVTDVYYNVEFYRINENEKIKVRVPLTYIGHSEAVTKGGLLIISHNEIEIQCFPKNIPDFISVDLSAITEIGQSLHAGEIKVSDDILILAKKEEILVKVEVPKTHEVESAKPAEAAAAAGAAPAAGAAAAPAAAAGKATPAAKPDAKTKK